MPAGRPSDYSPEYAEQAQKLCELGATTDDRQFGDCWALTNLQPLWAFENIKKGARYACA